MVVTCILLLELGSPPNVVMVTEPVRGTVLDQSALRYVVDFSFDVRRLTYRDTTLPWNKFTVRKNQCVTLR
jgi:hypothetical protein